MGSLDKLKHWVKALRARLAPAGKEAVRTDVVPSSLSTALADSTALAAPPPATPAVVRPGEEEKLAVAFEQLVRHFDQRKLRFQADPEEQSVYASFWGDLFLVRVTAVVEDDQRMFQVFADAPIRAPEGARKLVAEAVARANLGLRIGKLEFDFDRGMVRYQASSLLPPSGELDDELITRLIGAALSMLDRYLPAIMSIIFANETPADAIRAAEADLEAADDEEDEDEA
jgi:hypothetical protein